MDNKQPTELPTDAEIAKQVDAFSQSYLWPAMREAQKEFEDGLIISLALMQKSFEMLRPTMHTETGAIDLFEELAATYVRSWRAGSNGQNQS